MKKEIELQMINKYHTFKKERKFVVSCFNLYLLFLFIKALQKKKQDLIKNNEPKFWTKD